MIKRRTRVSWIAGLVLLGLVVGGCGAESPPAGTAKPEDTVAPARTVVSVRTPAAADTPAATDTPGLAETPAPPVSLGEEARNEEGGFAYRPVLGWMLESVGASTYMVAPDAIPGAGPGFVLSGDLVEGVETLDEAWASLLGDLEESVQVSEPEEITVGEIPGQTADLSGEVDGVEVRMRLAVVQPGPGRTFVLAAYSPPEAWAGQTEPLFEAVLASVWFFEPVVEVEPTATPTATPPSEPLTEPEELVPGWTIYANANYVHDLAFYDGRLWAATAGGVAAWDPASDTVIKYTTLDGLAHNLVRAVIACPIPEPRLVAGTQAGISVLDPVLGTWETLLPEGDEWIWSKAVASLACAPESKTLLVGYDAWGLYIWNSQADEWRILTAGEGSLGNNMVGALAVVGDLEEIWAASMREVSRITSAGTTVYSKENTELLESASIVEIVPGADGSVWLGQFNRPELLRFQDGSWTAYSKENVEGYPSLGGARAMDLAPDGTLWIASSAGNVCQFDPETETCLASFAGEPGMLGSGVDSLVVASQGGVFVGSQQGEGISAWDGSDWRQRTIEGDQLLGNEIQGLGVDQDGMLWIGTMMRGTQRLDPSRPSAPWLTFDRELPSLSVSSFHADPSGGLWVGHWQGASYYDGSTWTHYGADEGLPHNVRAITIDPQGRAWFGGYGGLSIWDGETFENLGVETGLPGKDVRALLADGDVVWVATWDGGLLRFENDGFEVFDRDSGLPGDGVDALALDGDGSLLVGMSQVLVRVEEDGSIEEVLGLGNGLQSLVTSIAVDAEGRVWLTTLGDGVFFLDGGEVRQLTTADGLPTNQYGEGTLVIDRQGTVWFGGLDGGLARYVP